MRHFFSRRASLKRNGSQETKGEAGDSSIMASGSNNTTDSGVDVDGGGGESSRRGSSSSSHVPVSPPPPVPEWEGEPMALTDFASRRKVPGLARVVKGAYMSIGAASRFSLQKQHQDVFLHSVKVGIKVLAHSVKRVESQSHRRGGGKVARLCPTDQRLTVPLTYQGWFELLSEDGKSARPIRGVPELAQACPARCLVRENVKGYLAAGDGRLTFDNAKVVPAGEQLKLCREIALPPSAGRGFWVKLLHCLDGQGEDVYLSFDQRGVFAPIAEEKDVTGVFTIRDIIRRFRLPLTVKLVHGVRPRVPESKFSGMIRLELVYTEETAFVCPLEKNHVRLLPVPCDVSLQLVAASNQEELAGSEMFRSLQAKCTRMVSSYNNTLHLAVTVPDSVLKNHTRARKDSNFFSVPLHPGTSGGEEEEEEAGRLKRSKSREDLLMDEIDDLYAYVRDGGPPPKPKAQPEPDEESFWEEPAYEPLEQFRARLAAMESGQKVTFPDHYRPADPGQLRRLVGGNGDVPVPSALVEVTAGRGRGLAGARSAAEESSAGAAAAGGRGPPPLPPRPATQASATPRRSCPQIFTAVVATSNASATNPALTSVADSDGRKAVLSRRASAPLVQSGSAQMVATTTAVNKVNADGKPSTPDCAKTPRAEQAPQTPVARTLRSDPQPSPSVPSAGASPAPRALATPHLPSPREKEAKEGLRHGHGSPDTQKRRSGSTSSSSGQSKAAQTTSRDVRDSDTSSKTTKGSSSSSSGERSARQRMQTLYL